MIIDFHTHTFPESVSLRAMETLSRSGHVAYFSDATAGALASGMKKAQVDWSVSLPVMTNVGQVEKVNRRLMAAYEALRQQGIITFGGLHPDYENYRAEIAELKAAGIRGIKLHPAFQQVPVNDIRYKRIIGAVSDAGMITLIHCGLDVNYPGRNFAGVPELLEVIRDVRPEKTVLAHMGGWQTWYEVEKDLAGAPVWLDTAYSLGPVYPRKGEDDLLPFRENLSHERFVRLARRHGTDRVLFATDSPWSKQEEYVAFIRQSPLTEEEKAQIFSENALKLLNDRLEA